MAPHGNGSRPRDGCDLRVHIEGGGFRGRRSQVVELLEGVFGGIFGALSGGSCACCGLLILLLGLILAFTMKEEVPTSYKVDAEGKIVLDHSGTGVSPESMQNSDGPDGLEGGSSEDTDAWYKQN